MHSTLRIARLLLPLVAFFLVGTAQAQAELSLADLVTRALQENYQIRIFRNIERTSVNNNTIGNAGMLPTVNLTGQRRTAVNNSRQQFFTGDSQAANNAKSTATSADLEVNWIVFDGLAMFARRDQLAQLELLSQGDTRFFMEQTVADLVTAYYQLKQESQLLAAFRKTLDVSQARLTFAERAFEIGSSNMLDVQLARVDCNTDSSLVLNQQAQVQEITIAINRLINRDLTAALIPTDSIVLQDDFSLPELLASARLNNTQLSQQQLQELVAMSQVEINKGALFPTVEVYGNYGFNRQANEVGFLQSSRTFGPEYGIRVRFNLFSGYQEKIAEQNARINVETTRLQTQDLDQQVEQSLRVAYLRWQTSAQQARLERESVVAANEALAIARRQYELNALTNVEFRVIQLNAINAETRFLAAQYAAKVREVELLRVSGKLLEGG
jgi:outer membrane protein